MNTNENTLILGMVDKLEWDKLSPFVISLERTGYKGELCFFVSNVSKKTIYKLQEHGVQVMKFRDFYFKFPFIKQEIHIYHFYRRLPFTGHFPYFLYKLFNSEGGRLNSENLLCKDKIVKVFLNLNLLSFPCSRFLMYYLFLKNTDKYYSKVLLTDISDVLFQRHPFDFEYRENSLYSGLEENIIAADRLNSRWIAVAFGQQVLSELGHYRVISNGQIIGNQHTVLKYLQYLVHYIIQTAYKQINVHGIDQGIHNFIIRKGLIRDVVLNENQGGPILTLGNFDPARIRYNKDGLLINVDGSIINILHHYDWHGYEKVVENVKHLYEGGI